MLDVVAERYRELGQRFERCPPPPLDLVALLALRRLDGSTRWPS